MKLLKSYYSQIDNSHLHLLDDVSYNPVFIIGAQRSGTTLLYKLLADTNKFNYISTYHLLRYGEILNNHITHNESNACRQVQDLIDSFGSADREVDQIPVSPNAPEEYGFILGWEGYQQMLNRRSISFLHEICKKIQYTSGHGDRMILLKNPIDALNFKFIYQSFPDAKFIFINRDPIQSINSWTKFWIKILESKSMYAYHTWRFYRLLMDNPAVYSVFKFFATSQIFDVRLKLKAQYWKLLQDYFFKNIDLIPPEQKICTTYEAICQDPNTQINLILRFLEIEVDSNIDYSNIVKPRSGSLLPDIEQQYSRLATLFKPMISYIENSLSQEQALAQKT